MKIVTLGDSITEGLGSYGCSYPEILRDLITQKAGGTILTNLAHSAFQISDSANLMPKVLEAQPDIIIIAHGITEAIVRPSHNTLRLIPPRWRRPGWLDPRPYFSRRKFKGFSQRIESAIRWRIKVALLKVFGGATWMSQDDFARNLDQMLKGLLNQTDAEIILLTQCGLDTRFFPGSSSSLFHYQKRLENLVLSTASSRIQICDVSCLLDRWDDFLDDHFHPNTEGHKKIALALLRLLQIREPHAEYEELSSNCN